MMEHEKPRLLDLLCAPGHFRPAIGNKKLSHQLIYSVSKSSTKLLKKEKLFTFIDANIRIKKLEYISPLEIKLKDGSLFKIELLEKSNSISSSLLNTKRSLCIKAFDPKGKELKKWVLWQEAFEESID